MTNSESFDAESATEPTTKRECANANMSEEICDGVRILCERMENNPDDFVKSEFNPNSMEHTTGRFYYDGRNIEGLAKGHPDSLEVYWHLTQAERDALVQSYTNMMRNEFTRRVVEKLLDAPKEEEISSKKAKWISV